MITVWELQVIKYYQQYKEIEKKLIDTNDLFGALAHFRIARNFSGIAQQDKKNELLGIINSVIQNKKLTSKEKYNQLLNKFKNTYEKELISATSKILWFVDSKQDFIIYDTLAVNSLSNHKKLANKNGSEKYFDFCEKWHELYNENEEQITQAIERTKDFFRNSPNFNNKDVNVMNETWFKMRVLDMYLWNFS